MRALVRDPKSAAARGLASLGAELVVGDMDDGASLRTAMRGVHGAFSVQPARIPPTFAENELGRGVNVVDAARAAGLQHLVYSSSLLRSISPNDIVQHVAIDDVAAFTGLALGDPSRYVGKALELAGDELTMAQVLDAIGRATRRRDLREWTKRTALHEGSGERPVRYGGWHADIAVLRALHPGLMTFDDWLAKGALLGSIRRWPARTAAARRSRSAARPSEPLHLRPPPPARRRERHRWFQPAVLEYASIAARWPLQSSEPIEHASMSRCYPTAQWTRRCAGQCS